jgi:uncharacterized membrane protein YedE/YeeE
MATWFSGTWPWYLAGPIIGLGVSSNLRPLCSAVIPGRCDYFRYHWKKVGSWNLIFLTGILIGGFLASRWGSAHDIAISPQTKFALTHLGIHDFSGVSPHEIFHWHALLTLRGFVSIVLGGFLVGFGTAYAGGCTSGQALSGLADFQLPSLIAVLGFFAGGLLATYFLLPLLF